MAPKAPRSVRRRRRSRWPRLVAGCGQVGRQIYLYSQTGETPTLGGISKMFRQVKLTHNDRQLLERIVLTRAMMGRCDGSDPPFLRSGQTLWEWFEFRSKAQVRDYQRQLGRVLEECPRVKQALKEYDWYVRWRKDEYYIEKRWFRSPPGRTNRGVEFHEKSLEFIDEFGEIAGCDYDYAAGVLRDMLGGKVLPKALVSLLDEYDENRSLETALDLILYDETLLVCFYDNERTKRFHRGIEEAFGNQRSEEQGSKPANEGPDADDC